MIFVGDAQVRRGGGDIELVREVIPLRLLDVGGRDRELLRLVMRVAHAAQSCAPGGVNRERAAGAVRVAQPGPRVLPRFGREGPAAVRLESSR